MLGTARGVLILRGASVVANGAALVLLGVLLRRAYPRRGHVLWMLPMIATCPVWLVVLRTGIEVVMFTPLLTVLGLYAFIAAIIGGFNQVRGAILGGLLLGVIDNFCAVYVSSNYRMAIPLLILIVVILVRPQGLLGRAEERTV